jgi:uncharacterized protein YeaO (DUF488 family)
MASLGPSERLLRWFLDEGSGARAFREFTRRYTGEILGSTSSETGNIAIKNRGQKFTLRLLRTLARKQNVTLLCQCDENEPHCHRHLLKALIESA